MSERPAPSGRTVPGVVDRLRAHRRRTLLLVALLPVLVIVWWPIIMGGGTAKPPTPIPTSLATEPPPAAPGVESAPTVTASLDDIVRRVVATTRGFEPRWPAAPDGDPFAAAAGPLPSETRPERIANPDELKVSGIFLGEGLEPVAVIDGRTCRRGDDIGGYRVQTISEGKVVLRIGDRMVEISMKRPGLGARDD